MTGSVADRLSGAPRWRLWLLAARPATLPAAVVPVLVGTAAALPAEGALPRPLAFLAALLCSLLIQVGTNFANDYFDFRKGADTAARLGPTRVSQAGLIAPSQVLTATLLAFGLAALVGLYLIAIGGWPILLVGALSILSGLAYTGGPYPLGYHGLGDLFVFVFFGLAAVVGSAYLQTGRIEPVALGAAIPTGLLVTAILVVNNLRDADTDRAAGKMTLAARLGRRAARIQYGLLVLGAYLFPPALPLFDPAVKSHWLPWLTLPLGLMLVGTVATRSDGPTLNRALKQTGLLHLLFGLLFAGSMAA
ncbi:MAG TPA: 1,4-dihydroxy-2-naphthoate polyprenyltransferase [Chloroflexota bacterium]